MKVYKSNVKVQKKIMKVYKSTLKIPIIMMKST